MLNERLRLHAIFNHVTLRKHQKWPLRFFGVFFGYQSRHSNPIVVKKETIKKTLRSCFFCFFSCQIKNIHPKNKSIGNDNGPRKTQHKTINHKQKTACRIDNPQGGDIFHQKWNHQNKWPQITYPISKRHFHNLFFFKV